MPHLKVNVNGKKYTLSGLTRATCSKQILCALAKVDAELQATQAFRSELQKDSGSGSGIEEQCNRPRKARESKKKLRREEKCSTHKNAELKGKNGKKNTGRKARSTNLKKSVELDSKGIQTSCGMLEALGTVIESQQSCLPSQHEEKDLKGDFVKKCLPTSENLERSTCGHEVQQADNKGASVEDQAKDTDHDTGVSELHSDSSFELNQMLRNTEKGEGSESLGEKTINRTSPVTVKCVSTNTDPMDPADTTDPHMPESETLNFLEDGFIVAQLIGSETDVETDDECTCVYVDSGSEELREEIGKVRGDLKLTEAKLTEQNKMIETLNSLIGAEEITPKECSATSDVTADVTKQIDELKQSIKLSNHLYDYQKLETQANALELDRVESQIRRKRWHVESLLKELHSVRKNSIKGAGQGRSVNNSREGTLV